MMLEVKDGQLQQGDSGLGPSTALFIDVGEPTPNNGAYIKTKLPNRLDYAFCLDNGKVVGLESKTVSDLISSWRSRRLQRQLRDMLSEVDIPVLLVRASDEIDYIMLDAWPEIQVDLVKWQLIGGYLFMAPYETEHLFSFLSEAKAAMNGQRNLRTIISGVDRTKPKGNKQEAALQAIIKGCGPVMSKKLIGTFHTVGGVLRAKDKELREAGATSAVVRRVAGLR